MECNQAMYANISLLVKSSEVPVDRGSSRDKHKQRNADAKKYAAR